MLTTVLIITHTDGRDEFHTIPAVAGAGYLLDLGTETDVARIEVRTEGDQPAPPR